MPPLLALFPRTVSLPCIVLYKIPPSYLSSVIHLGCISTDHRAPVIVLNPALAPPSHSCDHLADQPNLHSLLFHLLYTPPFNYGSPRVLILRPKPFILVFAQKSQCTIFWQLWFQQPLYDPDRQYHMNTCTCYIPISTLLTRGCRCAAHDGHRSFGKYDFLFHDGYHVPLCRLCGVAWDSDVTQGHIVVVIHLVILASIGRCVCGALHDAEGFREGNDLALEEVVSDSQRRFTLIRAWLVTLVCICVHVKRHTHRTFV